MAVTWHDVAALAPALADLSVGAQSMILASAVREVKAPEWGDAAGTAQVYFAAHLGALVLRDANGAPGPVTGEAVGEVSRSYAAPSALGDPLESTVWGREYKRLLRQCFAFVGMVA